MGNEPLTIRRFLIGITSTGLGIPLLFYLNFGEVGPVGWGLTIFLIVLLSLYALGMYASDHPEYSIEPRFDWLDKVGMFWLIWCGLGPFCGWVVTAFPPTETSWRWQYGVRVLLAVVLPVLTALPLVRYVRRKAALVQILILVVVTALPVWSGFNSMLDLYAGTTTERMSRDCITNAEYGLCGCEGKRMTCAEAEAHAWQDVLLLPHTRRVLKITVE